MIRIFTAFSGYDSQCMALEKAGIDYELIGWSEIDKYAIAAHDAIFPQYKDRNYGDICVDVLAGIFSSLINGCEKPKDYLF